MRNANALNSYKLDSDVVFIVRTYSKFVDSTTRLLRGLQAQEGNNSISSIILSTDLNSTFVLRSKVQSLWSNPSNKRPAQVYFHDVAASIYDDNCCQVQTVCSDLPYSSSWHAYARTKFGHYKHFDEKMATFCRGNNLLHYVLTDIALKYVLDSCVSCKYIVITNGDNAYDPRFVTKVVEAMADPSLDMVLTDYLERGTQVVKSQVKLNQMDLGALAFRVSSLRKYGLLYLDTLPIVAWPSDYYAADGEFVNFLVHFKGAKVGKVNKVLFTHW